MTKEGEGEDAPLRIYHASAPANPVLNLVKVARCLGVAVELIDLQLSSSPNEDLRAQLSSGKGASVWDVGSLSAVIGLADWEAIASALASSSASVLILATGEGDPQAAVVK